MRTPPPASLQSAPADPLDAFTADVQAVRADLDATRARFDRAIDGMAERSRTHARRQRIGAAVVALLAALILAGALYGLHAELTTDAARAIGPVREAPVFMLDAGP